MGYKPEKEKVVDDGAGVVERARARLQNAIHTPKRRGCLHLQGCEQTAVHSWFTENGVRNVLTHDTLACRINTKEFGLTDE